MLELEVGIVPPDDISAFLSGLHTDGTLRKADYEYYLITSLVKSPKKILKTMEALENDNDKTILQFQVLEEIYKVNNKVRPKYIQIADNRLLHVSDVIQEGLKDTLQLEVNPTWFSNTDIEKIVNPEHLIDVVTRVWDEISANGLVKRFVKYKVGMIDIELPFLDLHKDDISHLVKEFISRCGNVTIARQNKREWQHYVISLVIPNSDSMIYALIEGKYMDVYTDHALINQLYISASKVNPNLKWETINWANFISTNEGGSRRVPVIKKPGGAIPKRPGLPKGQPKEEEQEKPKFTDVDFSNIIELAERLKKRVVGQEQAITELADAIMVSRVGLRAEHKPIGSFLLAGTTGVGKTELCKVLAEELTNVPLIRIDCSEFQQSHEVSKLFGAPPGYIGFEDNSRQLGDNTPPTTLASKIKLNPFSVVLFDEIEKAHEAVFSVLLQMMDEGHITSGRGDTVSFKEAIILLTSNIGTQEAAEACARPDMGFTTQEKDLCKIESEVIDKAIKKKFSPEFLNRLSQIIMFNKLDKDVCMTIVDTMLDKTKVRLEKSQHMTMKWGNDVREYLVEIGYSDEYGARNLERTIQKYIELPLAKEILRRQFVKTSEEKPTEDKAKVVGFDPSLDKTIGITIYVKDDSIKFRRDSQNGKKDNTKSERLLLGDGNTDKRKPDKNKT
jgi:hypothetical protein